MGIIKIISGSAKLRLILPAIMGFVAYGAWAYFANDEFTTEVALKAAMTQGSYSFIITLILSVLIEYLYKRLNKINHHHWWVISISCLLLYSSSWFVNFIAETPNIVMTILPGAMMSTIFTVVYVFNLKQL